MKPAVRQPSHADPLIPSFYYRSEIDGLRAIAVLAVVLFHAEFGCTGGYVGVDVFFVISGFLITSLIWKDLESGRFTFAHFWERRARRILPALVVVTLATLAAGWFVMFPEEFENLGWASASQAVFSANIYYWRDSGYFAGSSVEKPLLHTWSLAVEEQFYFIVPFVLWFMFWKHIRSRAVVISVLSTAFVVSFAMSVYGVAHHPSATFYLLPTRAWELLLGGLVAFLPHSQFLRDRRPVRECIAIIGLFLILGPVFVYEPDTPFPGLAALPPCFGSALLIWANGRGDAEVPTLAGRVLSIRPMVFIGLISYSFYLWHWPFLAFSHYLAPVPLSASRRVGVVGVSLLCALISWRWMETPFRLRHVGTSRRSMFRIGGIGLATVCGGGVLIVVMQGMPQRFSSRTLAYADAVSDRSFINEVTADDVRSGDLVNLGIAESAAKPVVLVWGDSHAMATLPAVDAYLKEQGLRGYAATHSSTAPVLDWHRFTKYGLNEDSEDYNEAVFALIRSQDIQIVILSGMWAAYSTTPTDATTSSFNRSLVATVKRLREVGTLPYVLLDVPIHRFNVPIALARSTLWDTGLDKLRAQPTKQRQYDGIDQATIDDIVKAGGRIIDPKPLFLDPDGDRYIIERNGIVLYRDGHHLTTRGAKLMLLPMLRQTFGEDIKMLRSHEVGTEVTSGLCLAFVLSGGSRRVDSARAHLSTRVSETPQTFFLMGSAKPETKTAMPIMAPIIRPPSPQMARVNSSSLATKN